MKDEPQSVRTALHEEVVGHRRQSRMAYRASPLLALNIIPMIDVVFLLLIYFLVATDFRLGEEIYKMNLPGSAQAADRDPFELDDEPLRIRVVSTGIGPDQYQLELDGPYPQPEQFEELYEFLIEKQVNEFSGGGWFEIDHPIIILPTRTARWEHAMEVFNTAARADYTNVTFAPPV